MTLAMPHFVTQPDLQNIIDHLQPDQVCRASAALHIEVGEIVIAICGAAGDLHAELTRYFRHILVPARAPSITVHVLEGQTLPNTLAWSDWSREAGKTGRKDAIFDLTDARLVHKVRTGMTFLQSAPWNIAFGPCLENPNQIINFINTQILSHYIREGWVLGHAAAVTTGHKTLAIAGLSGGGKSTTMLRLMDLEAVCYVTNDRLLIENTTAQPRALGIPKLPRINPGTILNNPRLQGILPVDRKAKLKSLSSDEIWTLEDKYDVMIDDVFGEGRIQHHGPLTDFWVLNWSRHSDQSTKVSDVAIADRPDLLSAIMKSPGPFFQRQDGTFWQDRTALDPASYLTALSGVRVQEVSGRIDFDALYAIGADLLGLAS
ncbi:HprK-related kinase B [Roseibium algae]|uniref:HprK-related kinase B n=1 Tax=Roseibium algae TaxID=3123038 RepID=A0ABU8TNE3_9HYPH